MNSPHEGRAGQGLKYGKVGTHGPRLSIAYRPDISGGIVGLPGSEGWIVTVVWPQGGEFGWSSSAKKDCGMSGGEGCSAWPVGRELSDINGGRWGWSGNALDQLFRSR